MLSNYALLMNLLNASKVTRAVHPQVATYSKLVSFELNDTREKGKISETSTNKKNLQLKICFYHILSMTRATSVITDGKKKLQ